MSDAPPPHIDAPAPVQLPPHPQRPSSPPEVAGPGVPPPIYSDIPLPSSSATNASSSSSYAERARRLHNSELDIPPYPPPYVDPPGGPHPASQRTFSARARVLLDGGSDPQLAAADRPPPVMCGSSGAGEQRMSFSERARIMRETGGWDPEGERVEVSRRAEEQRKDEAAIRAGGLGAFRVREERARARARAGVGGGSGGAGMVTGEMRVRDGRWEDARLLEKSDV